MPCPYQLTEVSGLRRNDSSATRFCGNSSSHGAQHGASGGGGAGAPRAHGGSASKVGSWPCNPSLQPLDTRGGSGARLQWATHEFGGAGEPWQQQYVLRTDAQITQMMDCRSPDASQCFNMPAGSTWDHGRGASFNVDADGTLITTPGVHGCANLPLERWSEKMQVLRSEMVPLLAWHASAHHGAPPLCMQGPVPYLPGQRACPVAFSPKESERTCKRYANTDVCDSMITGGQCWPGAGTPAVDSFNASDEACWTASVKSYCPKPTPPGKADAFEDCSKASNATCCKPLACFPFSDQFAQCCLGPDNPPGCASWKAVEGRRRPSETARAPPQPAPSARSARLLARSERDPVWLAPAVSRSAARGATRPAALAATRPERAVAGAGYCPDPKPAGAGDVYDACTPGLNVTCCESLKCIQQSSYFSSCCLAADDPPGCAAPRCSPLHASAHHGVLSSPPRRCASPPPPAPLPQTCGVQFVSAGPGYAVDALGKTTAAAFNTCNTTVNEGYNEPSSCNKPPTEDVVCDGDNEMVLVQYPQYGREQYECKQMPRPA